MLCAVFDGSEHIVIGNIASIAAYEDLSKIETTEDEFGNDTAVRTRQDCGPWCLAGLLFLAMFCQILLAFFGRGEILRITCLQLR